MMLRLLRPLSLALAMACALSVPHASAGDHAAANETIWPSQNDIAQTAGDGKKLLENQWAKPHAVFSVNNYALTGLTVPGTSGTLSITVASGTGYIAGRHVTIPAGTSVTAAAGSTNYVFLKLTRDGSSLATGVSFEVNTSSTAPADSTPIAILTAGASTITATTDRRILPGTGITLTSGTGWTPPAGIFRVYAEVIGASGGGGGGSENNGNAGSTGGAGGTSSFGSLTANGGPGGAGGGSTGSGADHATASGGSINLVARGNPGGSGGGAGGGDGDRGSHGGFGGYAAGPVLVTPGSDVTYAIGAAGTGGAGGTGTGVADGSAGDAGLPGVVVIHY